MKTNDTDFLDSAKLNTRTYQYYYERILSIGMNCFKWKNLPDTVDERFLMYNLFIDGKMVFFHDKVLGYLCLRGSVGAGFDVYNNPLTRHAYAVNGYFKDLGINDSVIIWSNYLRKPEILWVELFARRLAEIERTVDTNIKAQKTPVLILSDERQRMTLKNLYMKYDGNYPFIFGDKNLSSVMQTMKAINTQAPFVADKLQAIKSQIWSEVLTWLGVSNLNLSKKERLVSDEVSSNMGAIEIEQNVRLNSLKQYCKEINKMFGLNVDVEFFSDPLIEIEREINQNE